MTPQDNPSQDAMKARINRLIDDLDARTAHKNRGLSKQPPESWSASERHAWCVGFLEGGNALANGVRTILAAFVKETGLEQNGEEPPENTTDTRSF